MMNERFFGLWEEQMNKLFRLMEVLLKSEIGISLDYKSKFLSHLMEMLNLEN